MDKLSETVTVIVLGTMQDGGLPHTGCRCRRCRAAFKNPSRARNAACLAIVDTRPDPNRVWLVDATPDIGRQLNDLALNLGPHATRLDRLRQPDGIFLTHGHMGHTAGLPQLGNEVMDVDGLPVYASDGLCGLIQSIELWRPLNDRLELKQIAAHQTMILGDGLSLTPILVPHRDEWGTGTFGFRIEGPDRSLLYVPDIDAWEQWPEAREQVAGGDWALVDGSFYSVDELGGRPPMAHPLIPQTLAFFGSLNHKLVFTHLNHTNPVLDVGSVERLAVEQAGATIASEGQTFTL